MQANEYELEYANLEFDEFWDNTEKRLKTKYGKDLFNNLKKKRNS